MFSRMNAHLCDAIRAHRLLRFVYDGYERVVEPHVYGINTANHEMLSCWLVGGWSRSEAAPGWRNYLVRDMADVHVLADGFAGPRAGYDPDDDAFRQRFCRVESEQELAAAAVRGLLGRLDAAWRYARWDELAACLDPRVVIVAPGMVQRAEGRAAAVASYRDFMDRATLVRYRSDAPQVDVWGDTAVATFGWDMVWETDGTPHHESGHDVFVCRRDAAAPDGWVALWRTVTPAPSAGR
jgi:hypothetical protein